MSSSPLPPVCLIATSADLARLAAELRSHPLLALDTESNSLFAYHEKVCLIQLSSRTADYLIDPLAIDDMRPLGELTADPHIELVFHAAAQDVMGMKRDFGFTFTNIFDTMDAARILGLEKVGLAALLAEHFGVQHDKKHQKADWSLRPLPEEQQHYAQIDTHYLPALRDILYEQLVAQHRLEEAREIFDEIAQIEPQPHSFDEQGYWRISGAQDLSRRQIACLRELYLWREMLAQECDMPPFKIVPNETLIDLVKAKPRSLDDLKRTSFMKNSFIARQWREVLAALDRGRKSKPPTRPHHERADDGTVARHEQLKRWRKERALARGVESDIIIPRDTLWIIAKARPKTLEELRHVSQLGPWRLAQYGQEILQVLQQND